MSDIRLVAIGPPSSGKTSIIRRFLFNTYTDKYKPTIEDLYSKEFQLNGVKIKVDILDTAGQIEFPAMRRLCISNASAFLFVYTLDNTESFAEIRESFEEVKGIRGGGGLKGIPIVFAGNKLDLVSRNELSIGGRQRTSSGGGGSGSGSGGNLSAHSVDLTPGGDYGFNLDWIDGIEDMHIAYVNCSAKSDTNIQQVFISFLHLYKQITEVSTSSFKRRSSSKSSSKNNTLQTEEPKSRRSRSLIRRSSRKVKQQFTEPECRLV